MKIMIVCGNGLGSSLMLEMAVKDVLKELKSDAQVSHADLFTAKSESADLFLGAREIIDNLDDGSRKVASVKNIMDKVEIKAVLEPFLK
ncbi:PTS sugar transporter subunit IIB [Amantichitinum ursilacus]|uniref:Ascorbate-specific phosphotransferase enzyme IIB component n=1 Tax=Amantichitinum ursilacus TaxID=857265 RepID=A0A0N0XMN4_9NEIS|nr:PTS sugar transporter subunit IIB [Amantichitinum ursilacus]KPC54857.1 Ascorbate-specific phosphotransferase enzyme IIB component [Amantichitinum ursilacus]